MLKYVLIVCVSLWLVDGADLDLDLSDHIILNPVRSTRQDYCEYHGKRYQPGDKWEIEVGGGCGSFCKCGKGGSLSCASTACPPNSCKFKGKVYYAGQTWSIHVEGGCGGATCSCHTGGALSCKSSACRGNRN